MAQNCFADSMVTGSHRCNAAIVKEEPGFTGFMARLHVQALQAKVDATIDLITTLLRHTCSICSQIAVF